MTRKRAHHCHVRSIFAVFVAALALLGFKPTAWAQNPVPLISQPLVSEEAAPGGTGFTLTVNGTGFVSGSVVHWNGGARSTHFVNGGRLTANIPGTDIAEAGTAAVTVTNPEPAEVLPGPFSSQFTHLHLPSLWLELTLALPECGTFISSREISTGMASWTWQ